jgi:DNA-binding MarR family transcriptional regulator
MHKPHLWGPPGHRVGEPGTARVTFRGPLLPSRRRAEAVPDSITHYAGFAIIAAAHDIEGRYERCLHEAGISVRDFAVLAEAAQRQGIGQSALAWRVGLGRSRLSDQLSVLETEGLIERLLNERDLRRRRIWLTREGQHALAEGRERIGRADHNWLRPLTINERPYFRAILDRLGQEARGPRFGYPRVT